MSAEPPHIGMLNEAPLHAALKAWYAGPGAQFEVKLGRFVIDIVQADGLLVEIQTRGLGSMRRKLHHLTTRQAVRVVYPIAQEKWIVKLPQNDGDSPTRRKSPRRGSFAHVFGELVSFPRLILHPNFSLDVVLIQEEELRRYDGNRSWRRRGWASEERRLLSVVDHRLFESAADLAGLLPPELDDPFTTSELAGALRQPRRLGQQMCYCLREMEAITRTGKRGNAYLYTRTSGG
jgi:hypothetical protein